MIDNYTINDAWEDGYQVGYERGVLRALEYVKDDTRFLSHIYLKGLAAYLSKYPAGAKTEEEWLDILKKVMSY